MGTKNCDYCLPLPEAKKRHGNHTMNLMKNGKYRKGDRELKVSAWLVVCQAARLGSGHNCFAKTLCT